VTSIAGFSAVGILVALVLREDYSFEKPLRTGSKTILLAHQLAFWTCFLSVIFIGVVQRDFSDPFVYAWTLCAFFVFVGAILSKSKRHGILILINAITTLIVFLLPALSHYSTYNGAADRYFHLGVVREMITSGRIPQAVYESWPGWHLGVGAVGILSAIDAHASAFIYVGSAMILSMIFVWPIVCRLTGRHDLGILSAVLMMTCPIFLIFLQFLSPPSMCVGLFAIALWATTKLESLGGRLVYVIACLTLLISHHLSTLIVLVVLIIGVAITRLGNRSGSAKGEMRWTLGGVALLGVMMSAYWILTNQSFFSNEVLLASASLRRIESVSVSISGKGDNLDTFVLTFWSRAFLFLLTGFLSTIMLRRKGVMGIGFRTSVAFGVLGLFVFISYLATLFPIQLFGSILVYRWSLFGSIFASTAGGAMILLILRGRMASISVGLLIASLLLMMALSACAYSSYEHTSFRETEFGIQRMYYLESEEPLGGFVSSYCTGLISSDLVFSYYFYYDVPANQVDIHSTKDFALSSQGSMIVRLAELKDRGLGYLGNASQVFITYHEYQEWYINEEPNCVADVGTAQFLTLR
jgi:hypothetical protein